MEDKLRLVLTNYENLENQSDIDEYVDNLEEVINHLNAKANEGDELVSDSVYDTLVEYLRVLKPDSPLLHSVWSVDDTTVDFDEDLDKYLKIYPMLSIQTIKHMADKHLQDFKRNMGTTRITMVASMKLNGHGIRFVYKNGYLVKGTSRGRSTNGKDLTKQLVNILGEYNEKLAKYELVEVRAEVLLPFHNLEKARKFNPAIKSAFSGVASMIRESATAEEHQLLSVVCYDILCDEIEFVSLTSKYDLLDYYGFETPLYITREAMAHNFEEGVQGLLEEMDEHSEEYPYFTDGVVYSIDDSNLFKEFGEEDKYRLGNMAIKMGRWSQDMYSGIVSHIEWKKGKSRLTPVAVLKSDNGTDTGVLTATGNRVTNVPLYAPMYILMLEAYPNRVIHFRYGGESGVIPVTADGRLVTDKELK